MSVIDVAIYVTVLALLLAAFSVMLRTPLPRALSATRATLAVAFAGGVLAGTLASALIRSGVPPLAATQEIATAASDDDAVSELRAYAQKVSATSPSQRPISAVARTGDLPDVETMISRLEERLATDQGNAQGWRMLGWSYANTGNPEKAVAAYTKAAELLPDAADIREALDAAKASLPNGAAAPAP